jgi:hypothetical protein
VEIQEVETEKRGRCGEWKSEAWDGDAGGANVPELCSGESSGDLRWGTMPRGRLHLGIGVIRWTRGVVRARGV